jgi:glutamate synthase (NADPH/NADH) small chain
MRIVEGRPSFERIEETDFYLPADLVLLALGFAGPEPSPLFEQLGVTLTPRGVVGRDANWKTNVDGVYVCGDMGRGQSLVVWAIAEGRSCASAVDEFLMGETLLPAPIAPDTVQLR